MTPRILVLAGYFEPGHKGGGPVQSLSNLVEAIGNNVDFRVVANDRDLGDTKPYPNIIAKQWLERMRYKIIYLPPRRLSARRMLRLIREVNPTAIYGTGFFAYRYSILPAILRRLGLISKALPLIIAPRGEFSPSALAHRAWKKRAFLHVAKLLKLHSGVTWHATTAAEAMQILETVDERGDVHIVQNLAADPSLYEWTKETPKLKGQLDVAWVSRVHPIKNLAEAIRIVQRVRGDVTFTIFGPVEDAKYWSECVALAHSPRPGRRVVVKYGGEVAHQDVVPTFQKAHVFLFPTSGENFGHVIIEALMGGCPVITSDQTPWHDLEREGVGFSIPLRDENRFVEVLQNYADMTAEEYEDVSRKAFEYSRRQADRPREIREYRALFKQEATVQP